MPVSTTRIDDVIAELAQLLGDRLSTAAAIRDQHGHGESRDDSFPPDVVCFPASTAVLTFCWMSVSMRIASHAGETAAGRFPLARGSGGRRAARSRLLWHQRGTAIFRRRAAARGRVQRTGAAGLRH